MQSELETLKQSPGFEEHRNESFEKIDAGTECFSPACLCRETQTEPCNDIQESDETYAKLRRNLELEFQEKILKLITFEIPKDYFSVNSNSKDDIVPMGMVEALVKMCVECKWQRDTLERKVAELMKELRDVKRIYDERNNAAHELDSECRILKGNVETLLEELMVSKNSGGDGLAPIPENSEESEAMEQKIVMLEKEIEVLREARMNLEVDARALREEGQTLVKRLQAANALLRNQENLETEVKRWQEAATNAGGQLKEALAVKCFQEEEVERLREELQKLEAMNKHQVSSSQKKLEEIAELQERLLQQEELQNEKEALMSTVEVSLQTAAMEVERWKEMAKSTERQLNEALQVRDELEQECRRLYVIKTQVQNQEHLDLEVERLQKLSEGLEQNSNQLLTDKLSLEKQLADMRNQLCDLEDLEKETKERAANAEQQLRDVLHDNAELEKKIQTMHTIEEKFKNLEKDFVKKKQLSSSLQQELSEVTSAKCELEAECKRLLAVEGKLRNQENQELELKELREKLAAAEQELSEAVLAKLQLQDDYKKIESTYKLLKSEASTHEECETLDNREMLKPLEEQVQDLQSEQQKILDVLDKKTHENDELKTENSLFLQIISEQNSHAPKYEEKCQFQVNEATEMAKETIANLSKIIEDKDVEIDTLNKKLESFQHLHDAHSINEEFIKFEGAVSEQLTRLNKERAELITTVQVKHQESIQYHSEIQRLTGVLDHEMKTLEEVKHKHASLTQQYEEKEKLVLKMQNDLTAAMLKIQQLENGWTQLSSWKDSGEGNNAEVTQKMSEFIQHHAQEKQAKDNQIQVLHSQVADLQNQILLMSGRKHTEQVSPAQNKVRCKVSR